MTAIFVRREATYRIGVSCRGGLRVAKDDRDGMARKRAQASERIEVLRDLGMDFERPVGVRARRGLKSSGLTLGAEQEYPIAVPFIRPGGLMADPASIPAIADDFTSAEIAAARDAALQLLLRVERQFPGLVGLVAADRTGNLGKLVGVLDRPLHQLFAALTPLEGEDEKKAASKRKLAATFDATLGGGDHGHDAGSFEVALLVRRIERIQAQTEVIARLDELRRQLADDNINTGAMVVEPGLKALALAKTLAAGNPEFHSLLAGMTDALGDMTKAARAAQADARKKVPSP